MENMRTHNSDDYERDNQIWDRFEINSRLDDCFSRFDGHPEFVVNNTEKGIRYILESCFPEMREGLPYQLIPHRPNERKMPGCPELLFITVTRRTFSERTLEALDVVRKCRNNPHRHVIGVMYLTIEWHMSMDVIIDYAVPFYFEYGVKSLARREPQFQRPLTYY